jgi:uncharacterized membrane protein
MKVSVRTEVASLVLILVMFALAIAGLPAAPDRLPMHWNSAGQIDRVGGRAEGLLLIPIVASAIYVLMLVLPRIDPRRRNYDDFAGVYLLLRTAIIGVLFTMYLAVHLSIRGRDVNMLSLAPLVAGMFFIVVGNYLPKIKSNWFVGIRTPWTLSSEYAWRQTHRLAGWLFVIAGVVIIIASLIRPAAALGIVFPASVAAAAGVSVVYSYIAWRHDPARG